MRLDGERDGFAPDADDSVDSNTFQDDVVGSRRRFFRVDDGIDPCVTRRDVLERYAVYGDAVVKMNGAFVAKFPKALTTPRCVAKAINGIGHGARGGGFVPAQSGEGVRGVDGPFVGGGVGQRAVVCGLGG